MNDPFLRGLVAVTVLGAALPLRAQEPSQAQDAVSQSNTALQEVVVSATKSVGRLQDVSAAITAVGADVLQSGDIVNVESLQTQVPEITAGDDNGVAKIFMRGIGLNSSEALQQPGVALNLDGAVISRPEAQTTAFFDLQRVEVDRGPQGALYGRNAVGGAINLVTAKPTQDLTGYLDADFGNYNELNVSGALSGGLTDTLSARIAFRSETHAGYGNSALTGRGIDDLSEHMGRLELLFKPVDSFSWLVSGDWFDQRDNSGSPHKGPLAYPDPANPGQSLFVLTGTGGYPNGVRDYAGDFDPYTNRKSWAVTSTLTFTPNSWLQLVDIANYRSLSTWSGFDYDLSNIVNDATTTGVGLSTVQKGNFSDQASNELQVHTDFHWLTGLLGLYAYHEHMSNITDFGVAGDTVHGPAENLAGAAASGVNAADIFAACGLGSAAYTDGTLNPPPGFCIHTQEVSKSLALFGQYQLHLGELFDPLRGVSLKFGGRYSHETLSINTPGGFAGATAAAAIPAGLAARTWNNFSPTAGAEWKINKDLLLYYTFSEGFIAGVAEAFTPGSTDILNPEYIQNHEVGLKWTLWDGRMTANLAAFRYNIEGLQVQKTEPYGQNGVPVQVFENAAGARAVGVEEDLFAAPIDSLRLNLSTAYLHSYFTDYTTQNPLDIRNLINPTTVGNQAPFISLVGYPTRNSPRWTVNAGAEVDIPGTKWLHDGIVTLRGELLYRSTTYYSEFQDPAVGQSGFTMANAYLKWHAPDSKLSVSLWVRNLTDKLAVSSAYPFNTQGFIGVEYYAPRTYGASIDYHL